MEMLVLLFSMASSRVRANIGTEISKPVTFPSGPTLSESKSVVVPVPQPTSSMESPF